MFSLDPRGGHNRYKFNKDFFKKWSPEMAYVLRFLYADGNITDAVSSRSQYTSFYSSDRVILEKIKVALSSNHPIEIIPRKTHIHKNGIYRSKNGFKLRIGSREIFQDLLKFGVIPNKSKVITFPDVPAKYLGSFIRGNFDGDGCVFLEKAKGITQPIIIKRLSVIFSSGSYQFLAELARILKKNLFIEREKVYNGIRSYQLRYFTNDSIKIFKLMYSHCPPGLYLSRKLEIFNDYFKLAPKKIDSEIANVLN